MKQAERASDARTFLVHGVAIPAAPLAAGLYVVATPIGNLSDVTLRALAVLAAADAILAEDTRVSRTLLARYGITTPLSPYHDHNAAQARPRALKSIAEGEALALISDAGTPLVSDPGFKLVAEAVAAGLHVTAAPGASAALAALAVAGLPTDRFFFEGFLPPRSAARRERINALAAVPGTLVVYETPSRIPETLADPKYDVMKAVEFTDIVMSEDAAICELNQQGLHALSHAAGVLMPEEYAIRQFQDWVRAELARP